MLLKFIELATLSHFATVPFLHVTFLTTLVVKSSAYVFVVLCPFKVYATKFISLDGVNVYGSLIDPLPLVCTSVFIYTTDFKFELVTPSFIPLSVTSLNPFSVFNKNGNIHTRLSIFDSILLYLLFYFIIK